MARMMVTLLAALMMLASACGGDAEGGVATLDPTTGSGDSDASQSEVDFETQALAYVDCLRENGVDMPDPEFTDDGMVMRRGSGGGPGAMGNLEAQEACAHLRPERGGGFSQVDQSEMQDMLYAFAQCMRDEGIDFPDPEVSTGGAAMFGSSDSVDMDDPDVVAALERCREGAGLGGMQGGMRGGSR